MVSDTVSSGMSHTLEENLKTKVEINQKYLLEN